MFEKLVNVMNLFALIVGILALCATIGLFDIKNRPDLEILEPSYSFKMEKIMKLVNDKNYEDIINSIGELTKLRDINFRAKPIATYFKDDPDKINWKDILPYQKVDTIKSGWTSYDGKNIWYRYGIEDTISSESKMNMNFNSDRNQKVKKDGVSILVNDGFLKELNKYEIDTNLKYIGPHAFEKNPLKELKNLREIRDSNLYISFCKEFIESANVYSIISISNNTEIELRNLQVYVSDVLDFAATQLVGWTTVSTLRYENEKGPNIKLIIDKLEAGQSMEIVFKGLKALRVENMTIGVDNSTQYDKKTIIIYILLSFLLTWLIFFFVRFYERKQNV